MFRILKTTRTVEMMIKTQIMLDMTLPRDTVRCMYLRPLDGNFLTTMSLFLLVDVSHKVSRLTGEL